MRKMNSFTYCNPDKVIFGKGVLAHVGTVAAKLGKRALVLNYDGNSETGMLAKLWDLLASACVTVECCALMKKTIGDRCGVKQRAASRRCSLWRTGGASEEYIIISAEHGVP